jgi:hypothetical protein
MSDTVLVHFEDYHHDGMDKVIEATEDEWQKLILPSIVNDCPIDASTVDNSLFNELFNRPEVHLNLREVRGLERVVPLV